VYAVFVGTILEVRRGLIAYQHFQDFSFFLKYRYFFPQEEFEKNSDSVGCFRKMSGKGAAIYQNMYVQIQSFFIHYYTKVAKLAQF
jgi:hypothetical protein